MHCIYLTSGLDVAVAAWGAPEDLVPREALERTCVYTYIHIYIYIYIYVYTYTIIIFDTTYVLVV